METPTASKIRQKNKKCLVFTLHVPNFIPIMRYLKTYFFLANDITDTKPVLVSDTVETKG